jgi:hypothetical protein
MYKVVVETAIGDHAQIWVEAEFIEVVDGSVGSVLTFTDGDEVTVAAFNDWQYAYKITDPNLIPAGALALNEGRPGPEHPKDPTGSGISKN